MEDRAPQVKSRKSHNRNGSESKNQQQQHTPIYSFNYDEYNTGKKEKLNSSSRDDFNSENGSLFKVVLRPNTSGSPNNLNLSSSSNANTRRVLDRSPTEDSSNFDRNDNQANDNYAKSSKRQNRYKRDYDDDYEPHTNSRYADSNKDLDEPTFSSKRPPVTPRKLRGNDNETQSSYKNNNESDTDLNPNKAQSSKPTASNRQMRRSKSNLNSSTGGLSASYDSNNNDAENSFSSVNTHGQKIIMRGIFTFDGRSVDLELYQNFLKWKSISGK